MKNILKNFLQLISFREMPDSEGFILQENQYDQKLSNEPHGGNDASGPSDGGGSALPEGILKPKRRRCRSSTRIKNSRTSERDERENGLIRTGLSANIEIIKEIYGLPVNKDLIIRHFTLGTDPPVRSFLIYIDGLVQRADLNYLIHSLMLEPRKFCPDPGVSAQVVLASLLPGSQIKNVDSFDKITEAVNYGDTAFFFEGSPSAVVVETKGWEHRGVEKSATEQTIMGPHEAFNENLRTNTALVRKIVRSEKLFTEFIKLGTRFRSDVAVMYMNDLASPDLVAEIKRRISSIKVDYITDTGMLEQFIEDSPYNLSPQSMSTERPDRVASFLAEGKVAVLLSGSPYALVVPTTMYTLLHTGEETYLRWQYGSFIRYVRTVSFYLALLLPGIYIAVVLFHQEMIPTELLLAIAGNREKVPFPSVAEILFLEFAFELVREAGLRIPNIIGSTIGIVGALILGQAAVQANLVSPVLVVLVAVTGLASFSIPSYNLAFTVRIYRFFYILMGAILGFYGITIALFVHILVTTNLKSFGVPYLSPAAPRTFGGADVVGRMPVFWQRRRPDYLNPLDDTRAPVEPRGWVTEKGGDSEKPG